MATKAQQVDFLLSPVREPSSGAIVNDGRVFFCNPGGGINDLATVYANRNKTVTAANPFVLGSDGTGLVFIDGTIDIVIKRTDGYGDDRQEMWRTINTLSAVTYGTTLITGLTYAADYPTLADALTAVSGGNCKLVINSLVNLILDTEFPATVETIFEGLGRINTTATVSFRGPVTAPDHRQIIYGSGTAVFYANDEVPLAWLGMLAGSVVDCSPLMQRYVTAAIAGAADSPCKEFGAGSGTYRWDSGIVASNPADQALAAGFGIRGKGMENPQQGSGTLFDITFSSGIWWQSGVDDGNPEDYNLYNGPQGFYLEDIQLRSFLADSSLVTGIRDYYGGDHNMTRVRFVNLGTGFYGARSDFNKFNSCTFNECGLGFYAGPRTNQFDVTSCRFENNDMDYRLVDPLHVRFVNPSFVGSGTAAGYGAEIENTRDGNVYTGGVVMNVTYVAPWFENYQRNIGVFAALRIHSTHANKAQSKGIVMINPSYVGNDGYTDYLIRTENARITVMFPEHLDGLKALAYSDDTSLALNRLTIHADSLTAYTLTEGLVKEATPGTCNVIVHLDGNNSAPAIVSQNGRLYVKKYIAAPTQDFYLTSLASGQFDVVMPGADGNRDNPSMLSMNRRMYYGLVANPGDLPTSGSFDPGDGFTARFLVIGSPRDYGCTVGGTYGTYSEGKTATTNGTTTLTLSAASSVLKIGMYITVNTTTRRIESISGTTVTLSGNIVAGSGQAIAYSAPVFGKGADLRAM